MWAQIFDFDGVIVHSEKQHEEAWNKVAKSRGKILSREQFLSGFGMKNQRFISKVLGWTHDEQEIASIIEEKEAYFQKTVEESGEPLMPGVEEWLELLCKHNIPCVIGSSSILKNIELVLNNTKIKHYFKAIISGEQVTHGKPNPEVFLLAAQALSMPPQHCVVLEDAPFGIEAAKSAEMRAIAMTTTFPKKEFEVLPQAHLPDLIVPNFSTLINSYAHITRWFESS